MLRVNNRNTRKVCVTCSKLTPFSSVFIINLERIDSDLKNSFILKDLYYFATYNVRLTNQFSSKEFHWIF